MFRFPCCHRLKLKLLNGLRILAAVRLQPRCLAFRRLVVAARTTATSARPAGLLLCRYIVTRNGVPVLIDIFSRGQRCVRGSLGSYTWSRWACTYVRILISYMWFFWKGTKIQLKIVSITLSSFHLKRKPNKYKFKLTAVNKVNLLLSNEIVKYVRLLN